MSSFLGFSFCKNSKYFLRRRLCGISRGFGRWWCHTRVSYSREMGWLEVDEFSVLDYFRVSSFWAPSGCFPGTRPSRVFSGGFIDMRQCQPCLKGQQDHQAKWCSLKVGATKGQDSVTMSSRACESESGWEKRALKFYLFVLWCRSGHSAKKQRKFWRRKIMCRCSSVHIAFFWNSFCARLWPICDNLQIDDETF